MKQVMLATFILILCRPESADSQWVQTNGPYGGPIAALAVINTDLFAGTGSGGVYCSTNYGERWSAKSSGIPGEHYISSLAVVGDRIFAGGTFGIYASADNGESWDQTGQNLAYTAIRVLTATGTTLFAATWSDGVFLTTDNGTSWNYAGNGLPKDEISAMAANGATVFAAVRWDGIYRSLYCTEIAAAICGDHQPSRICRRRRLLGRERPSLLAGDP